MGRQKTSSHSQLRQWDRYLAQHLIMCQFNIFNNQALHIPYRKVSQSMIFTTKKTTKKSFISNSWLSIWPCLNAPSPHTSSLILHACFSSRNLKLVVRTHFHVHWLYWCAFTASRLPHHLIRRDAPLGSQYNQLRV